MNEDKQGDQGSVDRRFQSQNQESNRQKSGPISASETEVMDPGDQSSNRLEFPEGRSVQTKSETWRSY